MVAKMLLGGRTSRASVPGQIFLFGEHAVLYGQPALASATGLRTRAKAEARSDEKFIVNSKGIGSLNGKIRKSDGKWSIKVVGGSAGRLIYVRRAVELIFNHVEVGVGLNLRIDSDIPAGSGLGSSSAVTVATIAAVSNTLGASLKKDGISDLAFETEMSIQGMASRTGVTVATRGGFVKVQDGRVESIKDLPQSSVVIGYTKVSRRTGKLIERVRRRKGAHPQIFESTLQLIGRATHVGIDAFGKRDFKKVGALMNANQMFLEILGASSPKLRRLISAAGEAGALGAKLTGAGGGGCMIALVHDEGKEVAEAIESKGGRAFITRIGMEGLKEEV